MYPLVDVVSTPGPLYARSNMNRACPVWLNSSLWNVLSEAGKKIAERVKPGFLLRPAQLCIYFEVHSSTRNTPLFPVLTHNHVDLAPAGASNHSVEPAYTTPSANCLAQFLQTQSLQRLSAQKASFLRIWHQAAGYHILCPHQDLRQEPLQLYAHSLHYLRDLNLLHVILHHRHHHHHHHTLCRPWSTVDSGEPTPIH
jgi:hypothetical protein